MFSSYRWLLRLSLLLAFVVVALGAYVRLSDAGLGCPDWPGCYGHLLGVPDTHEEKAQAALTFPQQPVDSAKAWKEMAHRYLASTLGLFILALFALSLGLRLRRAWHTTLLLLVIAQGLLGMLTVTLNLKPLVVTAHLLGGMTTLALLVGLNYLQKNDHSHLRSQYTDVSLASKTVSVVALLLVLLQIALGGWVSSNYAALACQDFPTCQGQWLPMHDVEQAFTLHRHLGYTSTETLLPLTALQTIHQVHRLGALILSVFVVILAVMLAPHAGWRHWSRGLWFLLLLQLSLGVANVLASLPLPLAVAHNVGAALLLSLLVSINLRIHRLDGQRL